MSGPHRATAHPDGRRDRRKRQGRHSRQGRRPGPWVTPALTVALATLALVAPTPAGALADPLPTTTTTTTASDGWVRWLGVTSTTTSVQLRWVAYHSATFMVRRDDGVGLPTPTSGTLVYSGPLLQAVDTDVQPWTHYRYTVWADDGAGGHLAPASTETTTVVPQVVGLSATATSATTATVGWTAPTDPGVAAVVVTRTDQFGAMRTVYSGPATSAEDTGLVPGVTYSYTAVAQDADGRRGSASRNVELVAKRAWTTTTVSPYVGWPRALACSSSTWCMAIDDSGQFQTMSGTSWSAPKRAFPASEFPGVGSPVVTSLTCPAAGRCLALQQGTVVEYVGGRWLSAKAPAWTWRAIDCPSTTFCVAIRADGWSTTRVGTTWTAVRRLSSLKVGWHDVACQAASRCFVVGVGSDSSNWRAALGSAGWTSGYLGAYQNGNAHTISCSATTCLALGDRARVTVSGATWRMGTFIPTNGLVDETIDVSCGTPTLCMAIDENTVNRWSGSSLLEQRRLGLGIGEIRAVSCPRVGGTCFAVDNHGRFYRWTAAKGWTTETTYAVTTGGLGRIGCRTDTACFVFDDNGWLLQWNGATWTRTGKYFAQPTDVDCAGTGFCLATDRLNRTYRIFSGGQWSVARSMPVAADQLSCSSPTLCLAVDEHGTASRFTGTTWTAATKTIADQWGFGPTLSCAPSGPCMLVGTNRTYRQYVGSALTAVRPLAAGFPAGRATLSCGAPTACLAVTDNGTWAQWNGSTWTLHTADSSAYRLGGLTCLTATHCAATYGYSNDTVPVTWNAGVWGTNGDAYTPDWHGAPECPTLATCFTASETTVTRSS